MAKVYLIITMRRGNKKIGEPGMVYPDIYDAQEVDSNKQGPIIYEGALSRGLATEECMIFVEQSVADAYKADDPPNFRIANEAAADAWLAANKQLSERREEQVLDEGRMLAIIAKNAAGIALSQDDLDALDPDSPVRGINRLVKTAQGIFET